MRSGLPGSPLIVAETIASDSGIGYMAMNAREFMQLDVVVLKYHPLCTVRKTVRCSGKSSRKKIFKMASKPSEMIGRCNGCNGTWNEPILKLSNISKEFDNKEVLRKIDLQVNKGDFIAVVGKSGCGKSTLLRMIAGLEPISSGSLIVNGHELNGRNKSAKIMFQDGRLLPWKKVYDNVGLGLKLD